MDDDERTCPCCDGTGKYETEYCWDCNGIGLEEDGVTPCFACGGEGEWQDDCDYCKGQGTWEAYEQVKYEWRVELLLDRRYGTRKVDEIPTLRDYWMAT